MVDKELSSYIPNEIIAEISPYSNGGKSLFESMEPITVKNVEQFFSEEKIIHDTARRLKELGFKVLNSNNITISISGTRSLYEKVFETSVKVVERPAIKHLGQMSVAHIISAEDNDSGYIDVSKSSLADLAEGGAFERKCHLDQNLTYTSL